MRINYFLSLAMVAMALSLSSCSDTFYQVYKATALKNLKQEQKTLVYEDENCKVSYNLWGKGGNIGFTFQNKTDENIYVNLAETFFIRNGVAYDYYLNRVLTKTSSSQVSVLGSKKTGVKSALSEIVSIGRYNSGLGTESVEQEYSFGKGVAVSSGTSVAYQEKDLVCVPPHSSKIFKEYDVNSNLYRDCSLLLFPRKKQIKPMKFTESNSPLSFGNVIAYKVGKQDETNVINNKFYISQITNYPESERIVTQQEEKCGKKTAKRRYLKTGDANEFYVQYSKKELGSSKY